MSSFITTLFQIALDIWLINGFENKKNIVANLQIWEIIIISIFKMFCTNLEILVILYLFYWKQRKYLKEENDLKLAKTVASPISVINNDSFEFHNHDKL